MLPASYLILTHFVQLFKHSYILVYNDRVNTLLENMNQKAFRPKTLRQNKLLEKYIKLGNSISVIGLGCIASGGLWTTDSLMEENGESLPLALWYPFDMNRSPEHDSIFLYEVLAGLLNSFADASGMLLYQVKEYLQTKENSHSINFILNG